MNENQKNFLDELGALLRKYSITRMYAINANDEYTASSEIDFRSCDEDFVVRGYFDQEFRGCRPIVRAQVYIPRDKEDPNND